MAAKLTRLTHKIAIQLHLVALSCTISSSRSRRPVRKLLDTLSYIGVTCECVIYIWSAFCAFLFCTARITDSVRVLWRVFNVQPYACIFVFLLRS